MEMAVACLHVSLRKGKDEQLSVLGKYAYTTCYGSEEPSSKQLRNVFYGVMSHKKGNHKIDHPHYEVC